MNDFEKYAKETLNNHPSPVDEERLWANIDRELRPGKRRPAPFWFWGLGLGLAAATVLIAYIQLGQAEVVPATQQPKQNVIAGQTGEKPGSFNSPRRHGGTEEESDHGFTPSWQTPAPVVTQTTDNQKLVSSPDKMAAISNVAPAKRCHQPKYEAGDISEQLWVPVGLKMSPLLRRDDTSNQATLKIADRMVLSGRSAFPTFQPLPTPPLELATTPPPALPPGPKTGCSDWGKGPAFRPYFGLYGGALYPLKSLSAKKTDFENIATGRQETETVLEGVAAGAYLGMRHRSGLFGEAGLEYLRINERFDLSSVVTDTIGKIAVIGIIIHAPGDTTFISDSVAVLKETRFVKRTYNNYRFLQVPLAIGYEWQAGNGWRFYGKAGVSVNINFRQKAEILNLSGQPEKFTSEKGGAGYPFRSKISLSPFATVGARYRLTPNLSLFAELRYLHQGDELTADAYPLRQQYRLPGGNVGAHFQF